MNAVMEEHTLLPPATGDDTLEQLGRLLGERGDGRARLVGPDGTQQDLPEDIYEVLRELVNALDQGLAINIVPLQAMLTTQQAADVLNVSRPTLVKLLQEGEIPYEQVRRHRRIRLAELLAYRDKARTQRRAVLDELTHTSSQDGTADSIDEFLQTR